MPGLFDLREVTYDAPVGPQGLISALHVGTPTAIEPTNQS